MSCDHEQKGVATNSNVNFLECDGSCLVFGSSTVRGAHVVRAHCVYWGFSIDLPTCSREVHVFPSCKRYGHCT